MRKPPMAKILQPYTIRPYPFNYNIQNNLILFIPDNCMTIKSTAYMNYFETYRNRFLLSNIKI